MNTKLLRQLIAKTGVSQRALADHLDVDPRALSKVAHLGDLIDLHERAVAALSDGEVVADLLGLHTLSVTVTTGRGWYMDRVGQVFTVIDHDAKHYMALPNCISKFRKSDVQVVKVKVK